MNFMIVMLVSKVSKIQTIYFVYRKGADLRKNIDNSRPPISHSSVTATPRDSTRLAIFA